MRTYPKIDTLFVRDEKFKVIPDVDHLRRVEFGLITQWVVTEKVDGTNVRIGRSSDGSYAVGGKTDRAQIPPALLDVSMKIAANESLQVIINDFGLYHIQLFGEGFGPKIQSGGDYRDDQGFILFDVLVNEKSWLDDNQVTDVASRLNIRRVPIVGAMTGDGTFSLDEVVEYVVSNPQSICAVRQRSAEGVVARPPVPLYDRRGDRVMFKLKTKDFA